MNLLRAWVREPEPVYAHCDIPCGIYTPDTALLAAKTVHKMVSKIQELKPPAAGAKSHEQFDFHNSLSRMVAIKEEHAQLCKKEVLILWTDYFKPENLATLPDLHDLVWKTTKLCSRNKQEVNLEAAKQLQESVQRIADAFQKVEASKKK